MEQKKIAKVYTSEEVSDLNETFKEQIGKEQDMGLKGKPVFQGFSLDDKNRLQVKLEWTIDGKVYKKESPACEDCIKENKIGYMKFGRSKRKDGTDGKWFMFCMNTKAKHRQAKAKKVKKAKTSALNLTSAKFKKLAKENPELAKQIKALL